MNRIVLAALLAGLAFPALAASKDYQLTGPVVDVTEETITVMKGTDKREFARTPDTQVEGELKKGAKVTVHYKMTATSVEVKPAGAAAKTMTPKK
jgi:hypothetical protein